MERRSDHAVIGHRDLVIGTILGPVEMVVEDGRFAERPHPVLGVVVEVLADQDVVEAVAEAP